MGILLWGTERNVVKASADVSIAWRNNRERLSGYIAVRLRENPRPSC